MVNAPGDSKPKPASLTSNQLLSEVILQTYNDQGKKCVDQQKFCRMADNHKQLVKRLAFVILNWFIYSIPTYPHVPTGRWNAGVFFNGQEFDVTTWYQEPKYTKVIGPAYVSQFSDDSL